MLPRLAPMLAVPATPFDSLEYGFEIKWDGIRALAAVETVGWALWGHRSGRTHPDPQLSVALNSSNLCLLCWPRGAAGP